MIPIKISFEINENEINEFMEDIRNDPQFKPVVFGFTAEHAEYQEFGTGPQRGRSSYYIGKEGREALDEWARLKVGITDPKERKNFVYLVARKIGKEGLRPRPFFRPAIDIVLSQMEERIDRGESLKDMADAIGHLAERFIQEHGMPYMGDLEKSWFADHLENRERDDKITKDDLDEVFGPL